MSNGYTGRERTQDFFWGSVITGHPLTENNTVEHVEALKHMSLFKEVPAGVRLITITMLPENTLIAAKNHVSLKRL